MICRNLVDTLFIAFLVLFLTIQQVVADHQVQDENPEKQGTDVNETVIELFNSMYFSVNSTGTVLEVDTLNPAASLIQPHIVETEDGREVITSIIVTNEFADSAEFRLHTADQRMVFTHQGKRFVHNLSRAKPYSALLWLREGPAPRADAQEDSASTAPAGLVGNQWLTGEREAIHKLYRWLLNEQAEGDGSVMLLDIAREAPPHAGQDEHSLITRVSGNSLDDSQDDTPGRKRRGGMPLVLEYSKADLPLFNRLNMEDLFARNMAIALEALQPVQKETPDLSYLYTPSIHSKPVLPEVVQVNVLFSTFHPGDTTLPGVNADFMEQLFTAADFHELALIHNAITGENLTGLDFLRNYANNQQVQLESSRLLRDWSEKKGHTLEEFIRSWLASRKSTGDLRVHLLDLTNRLNIGTATAESSTDDYQNKSWFNTKITIPSFLLICYRKPGGQRKMYRLKAELAPYWKEFARAVGLTPSQIESINKYRRGDPGDSIWDAFYLHIKTEGHGREDWNDRDPMTWGGILLALERMGSQTARIIQDLVNALDTKDDSDSDDD